MITTMVVIGGCIWAQDRRPEPFSEARKAIWSVENAKQISDSLKEVYKGRWTLGMEYGQRFMQSKNHADKPDTVTFTDFTSRRSFYGIQTGYFINHRLHVYIAFDMLLLPKEEDINVVRFGGPGDIEVEGSGNGGAMINLGIGIKYFFEIWRFTRLYTGIKIGLINAIAKGGDGGFSSSRGGRYENVNERSGKYLYGNLIGGIIYRVTPGFFLDYNLGYMEASDDENVGGMISPGGITTTLTLQFVIRSRR